MLTPVPTPLRVHIHRTDLANASFPLQPYIQPAHSVFTTNIPAGTCVVPVHPSQLGDLMLNSASCYPDAKTMDRGGAVD